MKNTKIDDKLNQIRNTTHPYRVSVRGIELEILPTVYPTSEVSELITECLDMPGIGVEPGHRVLDIGTGSGYLAIEAARRGALVIATDINPVAIECARRNASRLCTNRLPEFRVGDCMEPIHRDERFNLIIAGLPWDNAAAADVVTMSMCDPEYRLRRSVFEFARTGLTRNGRLLLTYSASAQSRNPLHHADPTLSFWIVNERPIKGEPHYAVLAVPVGCAPADLVGVRATPLEGD